MRKNQFFKNFVLLIKNVNIEMFASTDLILMMSAQIMTLCKINKKSSNGGRIA